MKNLLFVFMLSLPLMLASCQTRPDVVSELACRSQDYMGFVGQQAAAVTLPADSNVRILYPDVPITEEYVYERVNLVTDRKGIIREIACG